MIPIEESTEHDPDCDCGAPDDAEPGNHDKTCVVYDGSRDDEEDI
jgi:hypothetical protein